MYKKNKLFALVLVASCFGPALLKAFIGASEIALAIDLGKPVVMKIMDFVKCRKLVDDIYSGRYEMQSYHWKTVGDFNSLYVKGVGNIVLVKSMHGESAVAISSDRRVVNALQANVVDGRLSIDFDKAVDNARSEEAAAPEEVALDDDKSAFVHHDEGTTMTLVVVYNDLKDIAFDGTMNIIAENQLGTLQTDFSLKVLGDGKVCLHDLQCNNGSFMSRGNYTLKSESTQVAQRLNVDISGTNKVKLKNLSIPYCQLASAHNGKVTLQGTVSAMHIFDTGLLSFDGKGTMVNNMSIDSQGHQDSYYHVWVKGMLNASGSVGSTIKYYGEPQIFSYGVSTIMQDSFVNIFRDDAA